MIRETFPVGLLGCNCTVLGDETSGEAMVVDPGADIARIVAVLAKHALRLARIVVTHGHFDHIGGALELKRLTGAPILYSQHDLPLVAMLAQQPTWVGLPDLRSLGMDDAPGPPPDHAPADEENVGVGVIEARVIATPGHTPGSLALYLPTESLLIAGDTLFAGGVGRTDFPMGSERDLMASLHGRVMVLPEATVVVPGHGPETTIGHEAESNPFLR